ncbi:MAG TPA: DNA-3-methyladenine glycosylase I [Bryobacteraceae bacterium]|jgi:DNA-3-methyladenine glycosylase I|nr:DNA-3-methyladenine glycosylase I [Bryobacteraceae bacterium]
MRREYDFSTGVVGKYAKRYSEGTNVVLLDPDVAELKRCFWVSLDKPYYVEYHDTEWGVPVHDDQRHFEMLILEGAQAGLSWETILRKREHYRRAFAGFDPARVARFTQARIEKLLLDPGLVRNRLKIHSAVKNARAFLAIQKEFGTFDAYVWRFVGNRPIDGKRKSRADVPVKTQESDALSKDLQKRGFNFVGSTIIYSYMQAVGLVNDHTIDCFRHRS